MRGDRARDVKFSCKTYMAKDPDSLGGLLLIYISILMTDLSTEILYIVVCFLIDCHYFHAMNDYSLCMILSYFFS